MKHSIALVTGTTSGLGYAAASMLAIKGYRRVIVTGRSLARVQETAAKLAAETKTQGWSQVRSACSLRRASRRLRPRSSAIIN